MIKSFNYHEVGKREDYDSLYTSVLKTRNIEEVVEQLLNTPRTALESWEHLSLINEGIELLVQALEEGWVIGLVVDCDNDGIASSAELYRYIKRIYPNADIRIIHHKGKQHGLSNDINIPKEVQLLVLPDAGTNDIKQQKALVEQGLKILNIDHHELSEGWEEVEGVITVNPQNSPNYKNKSISGSGVTYKFLQALDYRLDLSLADDYRDLAGMGCLADIMDSTELDTRYLMNCSVDLSIIKNPFLKLMIQEKILKYNELNLTTLAWNVIPCINSTMRLGTMLEREAVFNAFILDEEEILKDGMKKASSCKSRQDRLKKKALEQCKAYIEEQNLTEYPIIALDVTDIFDDGGLNGVVANALANEYNRPILIVGGENEVNRGSCRNSNEGVVEDFRAWCADSGLFELNEGHSNAFGVEIKKENVRKVMELAKQNFGDSKEIEKLYKVERAIDFSELDKKDVIAIGGLSELWATNIKEPIFLIKNVRINSSKVEKKGSRNNVLYFKVDDFTFMKNFLSGEFYDRITLKGLKSFGSVNLKMDILCKFKRNEYGGKVYPQLEIIDAVSEEDKLEFYDLF